MVLAPNQRTCRGVALRYADPANDRCETIAKKERTINLLDILVVLFPGWRHWPSSPASVSLQVAAQLPPELSDGPLRRIRARKQRFFGGERAPLRAPQASRRTVQPVSSSCPTAPCELLCEVPSLLLFCETATHFAKVGSGFSKKPPKVTPLHFPLVGTGVHPKVSLPAEK